MAFRCSTHWTGALATELPPHCESTSDLVITVVFRTCLSKPKIRSNNTSWMLLDGLKWFKYVQMCSLLLDQKMERQFHRIARLLLWGKPFFSPASFSLLQCESAPCLEVPGVHHSPERLCQDRVQCVMKCYEENYGRLIDGTVSWLAKITGLIYFINHHNWIFLRLGIYSQQTLYI